MGNHFTDVGEQRSILRKAETEARRFLASAPEGALYVSRNNGTFQYRVRKNGESRNGKYQKKKDIALARALAQKDYCRRFVEYAERKEILFEHFGLMSDEDYQNRTVYKMELYNRNGYELGRDFLFTMETADKPLDMRCFERMIRTRLGLTSRRR